MEADAPEHVMRRLKKLLAMANDTASPNEAATAASMAEKLMRKYQLASADFLVDEMSSDGQIVQDTYQAGQKTTPGWIGQLAVGVMRLHSCDAVKNRGCIRFTGHRLDVPVAISTLDYLVGEVNRLAAQFPGGRGEKGSFRRGAASVIAQRLAELGDERERAFAAASSGTALVECKENALNEYLGRAAGRVRTTRPKADVHGYDAGRKAGQRVNLSGQVNHTSQSQPD